MTTTLARPGHRLKTLAGALDSPGAVAHAVAHRMWSRHDSFGLAADLGKLPEPRKAKIPVVMEPVDARAFQGFEDELPRVEGDDAVEVYSRIRMCEGAVEQLYVASDDQGAPIYAQWLMNRDNQAPLHSVVPKLFPDLSSEETLVEGAYTFVNFRGTGAMADGMHQLLVKAREGGASRCFTYVSPGNAPSLKGCARVGFDLDHVRLTRRQLGRRSVERRPPEPREREAWTASIAPSPPKATAA